MRNWLVREGSCCTDRTGCARSEARYLVDEAGVIGAMDADHRPGSEPGLAERRWQVVLDSVPDDRRRRRRRSGRYSGRDVWSWEP